MERIISSDKELVLNFKVDGFSQVIVKEKLETYQTVRIPKAGVMTEIGKPNLLFIRQFVYHTVEHTFNFVYKAEYGF